MLRRTLLISLAAAAVLLPSNAARTEPAGQRLSGPHLHETLAVYFVHGQSQPGPAPLTIDEAFERKAIKITETKKVREIEIENTGEEEVLIHAGDIVKGGWQDRVLSTTLVLPPRSGKLTIGAYCVERGRWKQRGKEDAVAFMSAGEMLPSREAKLALSAKPAASPAAAALLASPDAERHALLPGLIRGQAGIEQHTADSRDPATRGADPQQRIWDSVGNVQASLAASLGGPMEAEASKTSLPLTLAQQKLADARKAYLAAVEPAGVQGDDIVGVVFAVNGRISSGEVYASNAMFRKLWPKLVRAGVTEAIAAENALPRLDAPSPAKVQQFLDMAPATPSFSRTLMAGLEQQVRESAETVVNVTSRADGRLVHRNLLAR